jgi:hypothetical protein
MRYVSKDGREFASLEKTIEYDDKLDSEVNTYYNYKGEPRYKSEEEVSYLQKKNNYIKSIIGSTPKKDIKHYVQYLESSFKKQIPFEFTLEEFYTYIQQPCTYCGSTYKIGIDKINPKGGYTKDNCTPACKTCNLMKYTLSVDEFYSHIEKVLKHRTT